MAQGSTTYPTAIDTARSNPSNMDSSEAAILAMQAKMGVQSLIANDGAIPLVAGTVMVTKAGVCAMTLAAPTAAMNGQRITVISTTANAHTLTATNLLEDGVTGGAKDLATFAAFAGASVELEAYALEWYVVSKNAVTITGS
jgi:hypothetical protein